MLLSSLTVGASAILLTNEYRSTWMTGHPKHLPHLAENMDKSQAALCACLSLLPRVVWCIWNSWTTFGYWPLFTTIWSSTRIHLRAVPFSATPHHSYQTSASLFIVSLLNLRASASYFLTGARCYPWWLLPRNYWNVLTRRRFRPENQTGVQAVAVLNKDHDDMSLTLLCLPQKAQCMLLSDDLRPVFSYHKWNNTFFLICFIEVHWNLHNHIMTIRHFSRRKPSQR